MHREVCILLFCVGPGCTGDAFVLVPFPPVDTARSMILAVDRDARVTLEAHGLGSEVQRIVVEPPAQPEERISFEALLYTETLAELDLLPGPIEPALETVPDSMKRPLDPPAEVFELSIQDLQAGTWSALPAPSAELLDFRVPGAPRECRTFESETFTVRPVLAAINFAVSLPDGRALLGSPGRAFMFDGETIRPVETTTSGVPFSSADVLADGTIYLGGNGEIWRARIEGDVLDGERFLRAPHFEPFTWIAVGSETDVFTLSALGLFSHYDGVGWSDLHRFSGIPIPIRSGGLTRTGPGAAIAVMRTEPTVAWAQSGTVTVERLRVGGAGFSSVQSATPLGIVLGSTAGELFRYDGTDWAPLPKGPSELSVHAIVGFENGFFYSGRAGASGQFDPVAGFCALLRAATSTRFVAEPQPGVLLLAGDVNAGVTDEAVVTVFRRTN